LAVDHWQSVIVSGVYMYIPIAERL
jgi:hypothetical protein